MRAFILTICAALLLCGVAAAHHGRPHSWSVRCVAGSLQGTAVDDAAACFIDFEAGMVTVWTGDGSPDVFTLAPGDSWQVAELLP